MGQKPSTIFKIIGLLVLIGAVFFMPVREFLKVTFILGIPFIFLLGFILKKKKYSPVWIGSFILLLGIGALYINMLTQLPERIENRRIVSEGGILVAEGKYDEAISEYRKLEALGRQEDMKERIAWAENEKLGAARLQEARDLIKENKTAEAKKLLDSIPENTRAYQEAKKLRKTFEQ
ncbi:MAG: hypothetical protein PHX14_11805 [Syntrophomonadaceae bacterium]|nr:hypothetical protein [Syntrophomonadaceae bacterium]